MYIKKASTHFKFIKNDEQFYFQIKRLQIPHIE